MLLLAPATLAGHAGAGGHLRLVNVQRRRALDDGLHRRPPSDRPLRTDRRPGASKTNESDRRARSTLRSSGETPHARLKTGSQAPRQEDRRYGRRPHHPPLFQDPGGSAAALRELKAAAAPRTVGPCSDQKTWLSCVRVTSAIPGERADGADKRDGDGLDLGRSAARLQPDRQPIGTAPCSDGGATLRGRWVMTRS